MSDSRFTDVNDFLPTWDCRFKGKDENRVALQASDQSYIIGHYIDSREVEIKNNKYIIHKMKVYECGNEEHLSEPLNGEAKEYEFFGTAVINSMLEDPNKVKPGDAIMIKWLGKVEPKTDKGRNKPYDSWKVFQDNQTPNISVKNGVIVSDGNSSDNDIEDEVPGAVPSQATDVTGSPTPPAAKVEASANIADVPIDKEEDDDLPF